MQPGFGTVQRQSVNEVLLTDGIQACLQLGSPFTMNNWASCLPCSGCLWYRAAADCCFATGLIVNRCSGPTACIVLIWPPLHQAIPGSKLVLGNRPLLRRGLLLLEPTNVEVA